MDTPDYYAVLGVTKDSSPDALKLAYTVLAQKHHPRIHSPDSQPLQTDTFDTINAAHYVLSNFSRKGDYDRALRRVKEVSAAPMRGHSNYVPPSVDPEFLKKEVTRLLAKFNSVEHYTKVVEGVDPEGRRISNTGRSRRASTSVTPTRTPPPPLVIPQVLAQAITPQLPTPSQPSPGYTLKKSMSAAATPERRHSQTPTPAPPRRASLATTTVHVPAPTPLHRQRQWEDAPWLPSFRAGSKKSPSDAGQPRPPVQRRTSSPSSSILVPPVGATVDADRVRPRSVSREGRTESRRSSTPNAAREDLAPPPPPLPKSFKSQPGARESIHAFFDEPDELDDSQQSDARQAFDGERQAKRDWDIRPQRGHGIRDEFHHKLHASRDSSRDSKHSHQSAERNTTSTTPRPRFTRDDSFIEPRRPTPGPKDPEQSQTVPIYAAEDPLPKPYGGKVLRPDDTVEYLEIAFRKVVQADGSVHFQRVSRHHQLGDDGKVRNHLRSSRAGLVSARKKNYKPQFPELVEVDAQCVSVPDGGFQEARDGPVPEWFLPSSVEKSGPVAVLENMRAHRDAADAKRKKEKVMQAEESYPIVVERKPPARPPTSLPSLHSLPRRAPSPTSMAPPSLSRRSTLSPPPIPPRRTTTLSPPPKSAPATQSHSSPFKYSSISPPMTPFRHSTLSPIPVITSSATNTIRSSRHGSVTPPHPTSLRHYIPSASNINSSISNSNCHRRRRSISLERYSRC